MDLADLFDRINTWAEYNDGKFLIADRLLEGEILDGALPEK